MAWKKIKKLGAGSYGTVFLAASMQDKSFFMQTPLLAVKSASDPRCYPSLNMEGRFLNEVQGSPYVVRCFGEDTSFEKGSRVYNLLLEYAAGGSLHDLIRRSRGNMPETVIAFYSFMLLLALSHIHRKGVVHCDIKPANILVFPTMDGVGHLKLADFGLARRESDPEPYNCHGTVSRNRGTLVYASPESAEQGIHKAAADIWALGITIIEMIKGTLARSFIDELDLFNQIILSKPEIPANLSEMGQDCLKSFFIRDPSKRPTADDLLKHPFIVKTLLAATQFHYRKVEQQINPFGSAPWTSKQGLFSATSNCNGGIKYYQLFPSDNAGALAVAQHRPFDLLQQSAMVGPLFAR